LLCLMSGAWLACIGEVWSLVPSALFIGFGYGLANPSATAVLARHVPAQASGLFFSMKQAGVPLGVALAGLCMPLGLQWLGWQPSVLLTGGLCCLVCLWLWTTVARLQAPEELASSRTDARWWAPLLDVGRDRALRRLGLVSLVYAMAQQGFLTFLVSLLHLQGGMSLAWAAGILAASQVASTAARVGFGHVADRWVSPPRLLGWLGIAMSLGLLLLAAVGTSGHVLGSAVVALVCGTFVMGWNGVFFAELVRTAPRERLASAAGTTQFLTFTGAMSGPFLVAQWVGLGGSYAQGMLWMALLPVITGVVLLRRLARASTSH